MIQINPREVAAEALMEIMMADAYNTMTLRRLLRQNGAMSRQDRAFVTEVVNGTWRNLIYIDHVLNTFQNKNGKNEAVAAGSAADGGVSDVLHGRAGCSGV
ncbi:MAG: transcription antitermination factor NusB [Anaerotignum faecicola]